MNDPVAYFKTENGLFLTEGFIIKVKINDDEIDKEDCEGIIEYITEDEIALIDTEDAKTIYLRWKYILDIKIISE